MVLQCGRSKESSQKSWLKDINCPFGQGSMSPPPPLVMANAGIAVLAR